ncbi:carbohydrate ABC transporter permease [Micromonospora sp. NPDC048930]|uniref:carbohydrate ABC transporter permease n=1 Tax=Micromonospora sp. NPDC048930 TaxID=3364261 RepID=UPI0037171F15
MDNIILDVTARRAARVHRVRSRAFGDRAYTVVVALLLGTAVLAILYPLYFIVIASLSEPDAVNDGQVWVLPHGVTLDGYRRLFADPRVWQGVTNSLLYTTLATGVSLVLILSAGYALSRKDLPWRNVITGLFLVTFFFDGGIIPRYLVVKELGMLNSVWAMVLPNAIAVWNLLIARTYFASSVPDEVREAAQVDGASELRIFLQVVLPLAKPLIAVLVLIHMVWNWNAYFDALVYLTDESKYPLQLVLRNILIQSEASGAGSLSSDLASYSEQQRVGELVKYAMIVVSTLPLLIVSPFAQRYLSRGEVTGAVKG